jgi:ABC-type glutathione transport system ATPase component
MREGVAIVFSTHQPDLARAAADQVMIMEDGRVVNSGPAAIVLHDKS